MATVLKTVEVNNLLEFESLFFRQSIAYVLGTNWTPNLILQSSILWYAAKNNGLLAQLGERRICNAEVMGAEPIRSTINRKQDKMKIYVAINHYSPEATLKAKDFESKAFKSRDEAYEYCDKRHIELCAQNYWAVQRILETELEEESK